MDFLFPFTNIQNLILFPLHRWTRGKWWSRRGEWRHTLMSSIVLMLCRNILIRGNFSAMRIRLRVPLPINPSFTTSQEVPHNPSAWPWLWPAAGYSATSQFVLVLVHRELNWKYLLKSNLIPQFEINLNWDFIVWRFKKCPKNLRFEDLYSLIEEHLIPECITCVEFLSITFLQISFVVIPMQIPILLV